MHMLKPVFELLTPRNYCLHDVAFCHSSLILKPHCRILALFFQPYRNFDVILKPHCGTFFFYYNVTLQKSSYITIYWFYFKDPTEFWPFFKATVQDIVLVLRHCRMLLT